MSYRFCGCDENGCDCDNHVVSAEYKGGAMGDKYLESKKKEEIAAAERRLHLETVIGMLTKMRLKAEGECCEAIKKAIDALELAYRLSA